MQRAMESGDGLCPPSDGGSPVGSVSSREASQSARRLDTVSQLDPSAEVTGQGSPSPGIDTVEGTTGSAEYVPRGWADAVKNGGSPGGVADGAQDLSSSRREISLERRGEVGSYPPLEREFDRVWAENSRRGKSGSKRGGRMRGRGNPKAQVSLLGTDRHETVGGAPMVLHEMFVERVSADVIDMAYAQVGQDVEAAIGVLLDLSQYSGPSEEVVNAQADASAVGGSRTSAPSVPEGEVWSGDGNSNLVSARSKQEKVPERRASHDGHDVVEQNKFKSEECGDCGWYKLPTECRLMIFGHLASREIARVSLVSKDFAAYAREFRARVTFLTPPRMVRVSAVAEMVAAFPNLRSLSLKRWGPDLQGFRRIFVAAAGIPLFSPKCEAQLRRVDDSWFVTACKRSLGSIDLRSCQHLTDDDIGTLCRLHTGLQSVDLSHCNGISDFSLKHLSRFPSAGAGGERSPGSRRGGGEYASPSRSEAAILPGSPSTDGGHPDQEEAGRVVFRFASSPGVAVPSTRVEEGERGDSDRDGGGSLPSSNDEEPRARHAGGVDPMSPVSSSPRARMTEIVERGIGRMMEGGLSASDEDNDGGIAVEGLKSLCLKGCQGISGRGLQMLLTQGVCKDSLTSLDVSECLSLTRTALQMSGKVALQRLRAMRLPHLTSVPASLLSPNLKELYLDNNPHLREVCYSGRVLECLSVTNCPELSSLQVQAPLLSQLYIASCTALRNIRDFQCPALRKVNAFMCRTLTRAAVETVIQDSTSTLSELTLSGCHGIDWLNLPHRALSRLEVKGCDELVRLSAESKVLTEFDARGSNKLEEVSLESGLLTRLLLNNCRQLRALSIPVWRIVDTCRAKRHTLAAASPGTDKSNSVTIQQQQGKGRKEGKGSGGSRALAMTEYLIEIDVNGCCLPEEAQEMLRRLRVTD
ncbi:hypothetical protein CBR_g12838 [Chara braunii]|uniref:F-box domain-containing protein n=1 Tax=Chara braunii TaxID=69332 RepID=A0A388KSS6_CHABU|nr:hypothetical protein CBR_g12838 [Chara braunii]|eukprot:GBG73121.1 hypothetical protein CBR_g12838 [Chara braunii]